jgi:putative flippase GtrA
VARIPLGQILRFGVVGVLNTLLSLALYTLMVHAGVHYLAASALAFAAGVVTGYVLNRAWTFGATSGHLESGPRYLVVALAGLGADVLLLWLLVGDAKVPKVEGQAIATLIVALGSFVAQRHWTFRDRAAARALTG